jgi:methionyl-tRNA formyltransferase
MKTINKVNTINKVKTLRTRLTQKVEKVNLSHLKAFQTLPIKGRSKKEIQERLDMRISKDVKKLFLNMSIDSELTDKVEARNNCNYFTFFYAPKFIYIG